MCLSDAGRVLSIDDARGTAIVDQGRRQAEVSLAPLVLDGLDVGPGDWLLIHTGLAVSVLDDDEAAALVEALDAARRA